SMPNKPPRMKLSPEEELFLRHWMFEEAHFQDRQGLAKQIQIAEQVIPADLAALIAAGFPDLAEQEAACQGPPPTTEPTWPWTEQTLRTRLSEARRLLAEKQLHKFAG